MKENDCGFYMFYDWVDMLKTLPPDLAIKIVVNLSSYSQKGVCECNLSTVENALFTIMKQQIDRKNEKSKIRADAANRRWGSNNLHMQNDANECKPIQTDANECKSIQSDATYTYTNTNTYTNTDTKTEYKDTIAQTNVFGESETVSEIPKQNPIEERFERFWKVYPKKTGKGNARNSFMKIHPSEELTLQMIDAVQRIAQTNEWRREGGKFIPYPATWLNQCRWEDETRVRLEDADKPYEPMDDTLPF